MTTTAKNLIDIARHMVCGGPAPELTSEIFASVTSNWLDGNASTSTAFSDLMQLAHAHELEHIVAAFLLEDSVSAAQRVELKQIYDTELYRALTFGTDLSRVGMILDHAAIDYIPLKGAIIRDYYPASWMRSSSDIDVLVRRSDFDRAISAITAEQGFIVVNESGHHSLIESKTGWIIELHFDLNPGDKDPNGILETVWDHATPISDGSHKYVLDDEFFYTYIIFHMAHHVRHDGACGIRALLDLWTLNQRGLRAERFIKSTEPTQESGIIASGDARGEGTRTLSGLNLETFAQMMEVIASKWFDGDTSAIKQSAHMAKQTHKSNAQTADMLTAQDIADIENLIIIGGSSGTEESAYIASRVKKGSGAAYAARRIFLSYDDLSRRYRGLQGRRYLTPIYQVKRWATALKGDGISRASEEANRGKRVDESDIDRMKRLQDLLDIRQG